MFAFIPVLLQWLAPAALSFFTPARCLAVFKAVVATIEFVAANHSDLSHDEQYRHGLDFLNAQYDLLDGVVNIDQGMDDFFRNNIAPMILTMVYGGQ